ncbi:MAG: mannitol dehydrogenase, partial [Eubacterium sp.]|nr:mannitol dehydrogenase [Eubacterium sp.]
MIAVMYGAGSIGRGFLAQLFSDSGYETVFIDADSQLVRLLNSRTEYPIRFVSNEGDREITVNYIRAVDGADIVRIAEAIAS